MANDLNLCQFIGRLGADPEVRYMADGSAVANFRIACGWKGKDKEGTEWINMTAFGKLAEICGEYLHKGSQVYTAGKQRTRKWQDRDGTDRYTTEIVLEKMQMLGGKPNESAPPADRRPASRRQEPPQHHDDFEDDSIPF